MKMMPSAWELNYYVARETGLAIALSEDHRFTERLIHALELSPKVYGRAFAAEALGMLFAADRPPRTSWFIAGTNYTMRNDELRPYQTLANEFMFQYMVESFDQPWW